MFSGKTSLTAEGIVLRSFVYKEKERILTLFTKEFGLVSIIVKRLSTKNYGMLALVSPLSCGEFIFTKGNNDRGNSDLYRFYDGTLLDEHLFLRTDWRHLETAGALAMALLHSQMPEKPAPLLYSLFVSYLKQIPFFEDPSSLLASFYLKVLHHEGLLPQTEFSDLLGARSFNELKELKITTAHLKKIKDLFTSSTRD